jgi:hypothetical protein
VDFYYIAFAIFVACTLIIWVLKQHSLYVLFLATYTHHFVVPFLYTHKLVEKGTARGLLVVKDVLLLELFAWCGVILLTRFRPFALRPAKPLLLLTGYCLFRALVGVVFLDDEWSKLALRMKAIWYPLEILTVVIVLTALHPKFGERFLRHMTYLLSASAVVALAIFFFAGRDFFIQNANVAEYVADVKGDVESEQDFELGLPGAATLGARAEAFADIASFRAVGTFGDGLTLSFQMATAVLLLLFCFSRKPSTWFMLAVCGAGLMFSLSRSGWLFCAVVVSYVFLRRRQYTPFLVLGGAVFALVLLWAPMTKFALDTVFNATTFTDTNDSEHVESLRGFYTIAFSDPGNILGKGLSMEVRAITESGYAYLLEHFGALAYVSFLWFCIALYRQFGEGSRDDPLILLAQGIPLGMLVVMHFSQYPFSFTTFISLWYVVGFCLSRFLQPKTNSGRELVRARHPVPLGNTSLAGG